jgi:hypothetical protein
MVGKPEGKKPLGRPRGGWEGNISLILRDSDEEVVDEINLA